MRKLIPLAATALLLAACGGDDQKTNAVELRGDEYAFVMTETIEGGWTTLEFTNTGEEWHEFALAKLGEGKTIADVRRYLADPKSQRQPAPAWVQIRAGIPTLDAGEEAALTQRLEPGRYVLLCFLDGPDGKTHIEHGMVREFVVEDDAGADVPEADATLNLGIWQAAPQLEAGERTIELRNDGDRPSSVFLTSFEPGKTEKDLERWEKSGMRGPAPARFLGGVIDVPPTRPSTTPSTLPRAASTPCSTTSAASRRPSRRAKAVARRARGVGSGGRLLAVASGRNAPLYPALRSATGRNPWQRFWPISARFGVTPFATDCHRLQPLGSIKAPSAAH